MTPIPNSQLLEALHWRYATKKFDRTQKISTENWATLEQALILSPSSCGLQPWKFLVITDQAVKDRLVPLSWGQTQPSDCSHLVVFTVRKNLDEAYVDRHVARIAEVRGVSVASQAGYRQMMLGAVNKAAAGGYLDTWQTHQIYIALGQFMASAALVGVDTCPMEGIEPAKYDEALGLTGSAYTTVVVCAAGYRAAGDKYASLAKVRFETKDTVQHV